MLKAQPRALERGQTSQFQEAVHQAGRFEIHAPEETDGNNREEDGNEEYPFKELGTGNITAQEVTEHNAKGILDKHGREKPGEVVSQCIEEAFLVGEGGKESFEVVQSHEIKANQLLPGKEAVEERHEQGE
jgi:hypothetical protein